MKRRVTAAIIAVLAVTSLATGEKVTITGTVVGTDGTPIADAIVATEYDRLTDTWVQTSTDADGRFQLRFDPRTRRSGLLVVAKKEGYALAWGIGPPGGQVRIEMDDDPGALTGTVVDEAGHPLPGVEVRVSSCQLSGQPITQASFLFGWEDAPRDVTDPEGRFEVSGLPAKARVGLRGTGQGWAEYRTRGTYDYPQVGDEVVILLEPEAIISGRVTRDGGPVGGVRVVAAGESRRALPLAGEECVTDARGSYTIGGLSAGVYEVGIASPDATTAGPAPFIEVKAGEHCMDMNLELIEGYLVHGTVSFADTGEPAVGARVKALMPWQFSMLRRMELDKVVETDRQGYYSLRLPPGENHLQYEGNLESYARDGVEPQDAVLDLGEDAPEAEANFLLHQAPAAGVPGVVIGPDAEPVAGAVVLGTESYYGPTTRDPAYTDEQGRFTASRSGGWLLIKDGEGRLAALADIEDPGETITVQLEPAAYATAKVVDLEGNPVPGVQALAQLAQDPKMGFDLPVTATSDEDGLLCIGPLPTDLELLVKPSFRTFDIAAEPPWDDLWGFLVQPLEPGETRELPTLVVNPKGRSLHGKVLDEERQPVPGARVICVDAVGSGMIVVFADAEGRFELTGLEASGEVGVVAVAPGAMSACGMVHDPDLPFEPEFTLHLQPRGLAAGVVYGTDGKPLPGVWMHLSAHKFFQTEALPRNLSARALTLSGADGGWRFEGLIPGLEYRVSACDRRSEITGGPEHFIASGGPAPMVVDVQLQERP